MLARRTTTFVALLLLALMCAGASVFGATTDKARILDGLIATPSKASTYVKSNRADLTELALDLVIYRWAAATVDMPADIQNTDAVIAAAANVLSDGLVNWVQETFATSEIIGPAAIPADTARVAQLTELRRQIGMALDYRNSSPIQSVNALTSVLDKTRELHLDLTEALVCTILGRQYHYDMSRYRLAEECYGRAGLIFSAYDCSEAAAIAYDEYGNLGAEMGRWLVATQNYSLAARLWNQLAKQNPTDSRHRLMAGREFIRASEAQSAAGDTQKSLELVNTGLDKLREAASMTKSYNELIKNLITVSNLYRSQNNLPKAIELLNAAARAGEQCDDPLLVAQVHSSLSAAYNASNLPAKAQESTDKRDKILTDAGKSAESALDNLSSDVSAPKDEQAKLYAVAERGAEALVQLGKSAEAADILVKLLDVYKGTSLIDGQIRCLRSLANTYDAQKKSTDALAKRMEAATLALKTNRKVLGTEIVREMVQSFIDVGDLDNALDTLAEFWNIMEQSGSVRGAADVLEVRGTLLASHGRFEAAVQDFQKALERYSTQVGDPWAAAGVSLKLADAFESLSKPADAARALEKDLKEIETQYADENVDPNISPERAQLMMGLYEKLAIAYIQDDRAESAENLLSKARHYTWTGELLSRLKSSTDQAVAEFAKSVDIMGSDPSHGSSTQTLNGPTLLAENWSDFSSRSAILRERYPVQYNALPINPLIELYKSRNNLPKKTLIIEYMLTNQSAFAFVSGSGVSEVWELDTSSKKIISLAGALRNRIKACEQNLSAGIPLPPINDWREPAFLEIKEPLVELYKALIQPIAKSLSANQILMFALPEELKGVPMHALVSGESSGAPRFMVQDFEIGYLAEDMLADLVKKDTRPIEQNSDRLAIFADPAGDLPGARKEAAMLGKLYFNSQVYAGQRATVANFIKECDKASILHIALHYNIDANPSKFVLQLAPESVSSASITVQELSAITNPHLQLVVLSACDSAASADPLESGPSRAAEVFSLMGAKSVLGGIWKVADASASNLMGDFYRTLVRGKSRTGALQAAQVKMIAEKSYAHPFYWACFAMYGAPW